MNFDSKAKRRRSYYYFLEEDHIRLIDFSKIKIFTSQLVEEI